MGDNRVGLFNKFKTAIALALMAMTTTAAIGQQDDLRQLVSNRDKKLASPFLRTASWNTSYADAKAQAKAGDKLIIAYFTRSYAPCGPCLQLEQTVLSKPDFIEFAKSYVLLCHISTRIPSDADNFLFAEKGGNAFPTLMVLDAEGNVLARQCGERSMRAVREVVGEGQRFSDMIRNAGSSDVNQRYDCLCRQIEYGHLGPEAARANLAAIKGLSGDRAARLEGAIVSLECRLALLEIRKAPDESSQFAAAKRLVEMKRANHIPSDQNVFPFWDWVMSYASHHQDVALYEDGLIAMRALLPNDPNSRESLQEKEAVLNRMKREVRIGAAGVTQTR
jgi:hypothetical protein